ncbi:MAG: hypothetical protein AAFV53_37565 [Myxococcota bacterium]
MDPSLQNNEHVIAYKTHAKNAFQELSQVLEAIKDGHPEEYKEWDTICKTAREKLDDWRDKSRDKDGKLTEALTAYWTTQEGIWKRRQMSLLPDDAADLRRIQYRLQRAQKEHAEKIERIANEMVELARVLKTAVPEINSLFGGLSGFEILKALSKFALIKAERAVMDQILEDQGFIVRDRSFAIYVGDNDLNFIKKYARNAYASLTRKFQDYGSKWETVGNLTTNTALTMSIVLKQYREEVQEIIEQADDDGLEDRLKEMVQAERDELSAHGDFYKDNVEKWRNHITALIAGFSKEKDRYEQMTEEVVDGVALRNVWHPCPVDHEFGTWFGQILRDAEDGADTIESDAKAFYSSLEELETVIDSLDSTSDENDGVSAAQRLRDAGFEVRT